MAEQSQSQQRFSFVSRGSMPPDTFGVVRFTGFEGLSTVYQFDIELISEDPAVDMNEVVQNPARFTILREEGDIPFYGIPISFEQMHEVDGMFFYRVVLAPRLWWLSQTYHNQVFLDKRVPEILETVLKDGGLTENDFELRLEAEYRNWDYVCQYRESHLDFASRWMEREGMYYFFEQDGAREKLIITDSNLSHLPMPQGKIMYYSPPSALDSLAREEVIKDFCCRQNTLPSSVRLKDYNYEKPSLAIEGLADVYEEGRGEVYMYGEHFLTAEEGNRLANIRAQEINCWQRTYHGESTVPFLRPGFLLELSDHFRKDFNRDYLSVEVNHQGSQAAYMLAGLSTELAEAEKQPYYVNRLTALPAAVQFRPQRKTSKARFYGTMHARIDAAGSGKYAEIDEQGRYKVILPFDRSGRFGGKASAWIRMMQPYAGPNQGMHFPLHKGTEVLLTFIDGDPDRPIIAGAVPNPETRSPVNNLNQTKSIIQTGRSPEDLSVGASQTIGGGDFDNNADTSTSSSNYIEFDDNNDTEKILLHSEGDIWTEAQNRYAEYTVGGPEQRDDVPENLKYLWDKFFADNAPSFQPTNMQAYDYPSDATGTDPSVNTDSMKQLAGTGKVQLAKGDTFITQDGNIYDFGGYWNYNLGNCYVEEHLDQSAALNQSSNFDLLNTGGPGWSSLDWSKAATPDSDDIAITDTIPWTNDGNGVWVEKKYGHGYSYTEGDSIEVTKGNSLEIQHGGEHVEMAFRSNSDDPDALGTIKSWTWSKAGTSREKKWTSDGTKIYESWSHAPDSWEKTFDWTNGAPVSMTATSNRGGGRADFNYSYCNKISASFDFSLAVAFSLSLAASVDLTFSAAAAAKIGIGAAFDFEAYWNPSGKIWIENSKCNFNIPGVCVKGEAALEAKKQELFLKKGAGFIDDKEVEIKSEKFSGYLVSIHGYN